MDRQNELKEYRALLREREQLRGIIMRLRCETKKKNAAAQAEQKQKVEALLRKYEKQELAIAEKISAIEDAIASLTSRERQLIRYRYFDGYSWAKTAQAMRYSEAQVYRIHKKIIKKMERRM